MNRVNPSNIVGVGGAQGSRERAHNIDRLTQSDSALKASNGGIGKGRMQGVGPDGKVYVTTLVERASGGPGTMRYFANGKLLTNITNRNDARACVLQRIANGTLGQLALGDQNAFTLGASPARVRIELGHRQPAQDGALQVARSAGVDTISANGGVELPNNERGGRIFAQMQHTRWQRNGPQPMEPIAKPVGASAPFIQGYKAQWSLMMQQQMPTTAAGNKREGNGLGWAPSRAAMPSPLPQARPSGAGAPSTQAPLSRAPTDTALGAGKALQSPRKAY